MNEFKILRSYTEFNLAHLSCNINFARSSPVVQDSTSAVLLSPEKEDETFIRFHYFKFNLNKTKEYTVPSLPPTHS